MFSHYPKQEMAAAASTVKKQQLKDMQTKFSLCFKLSRAINFRTSITCRCQTINLLRVDRTNLLTGLDN